MQIFFLESSTQHCFRIFLNNEVWNRNVFLIKTSRGLFCAFYYSLLLTRIFLSKYNDLWVIKDVFIKNLGFQLHVSVNIEPFCLRINMNKPLRTTEMLFTMKELFASVAHRYTTHIGKVAAAWLFKNKYLICYWILALTSNMLNIFNTFCCNEAKNCYLSDNRCHHEKCFYIFLA